MKWEGKPLDNLLIVILTRTHSLEDAPAKQLVSSALALKQRHQPNKIRGFHCYVKSEVKKEGREEKKEGPKVKKEGQAKNYEPLAWDVSTDEITGSCIGMYLVAHGMWVDDRDLCKIAQSESKEVASAIDKMLKDLKVRPDTFKKLSLDVCNAATTRKTDELNRLRLEVARRPGDKDAKQKLEDMFNEQTASTSVRDRSALAGLCKELGKHGWTPLIAGWDGYTSIAKATLPQRYRSLVEDQVDVNVGRKVHAARVGLGPGEKKFQNARQWLVSDIAGGKAGFEPEDPHSAEVPSVPSLDYRAQHKYVLQYRDRAVVNVRLDQYHRT
jgi:hypothetical protein